MRCAVLLLAASGMLAAHDLTVQASLAAPVVVTRAVYGESEAATFIKVEVFSPVVPAEAYQSGQTDRQGYFAFRPDSSGAWRVIVDDEIGHRGEKIVMVPEPFAASSGGSLPLGVSRWERAGLGVALLLGLTGIVYGMRARRSH